MKFIPALALASALLLSGCISRTTNLHVTLNEGGEQVLKARDTTTSRALATSAAAAQLQADLTNGMDLATTNGLRLTVNVRKDFRAASVSSDVSTNTAGVVKAGGEAIGGIVKEVIKPTP